MTVDFGNSSMGYSNHLSGPYSLQAASQAQLAFMMSRAGQAGQLGQSIAYDGLKDETVFGELTGWRVWNLVQTPEGWRLKSITMPTIWGAGLCGPDECERNSGDVKTNRAAGYYAFKTKEEMFSGMGLCFDIYGEVLLYGDAVEFKRGYHAEYCRIVALYPNPHSQALQAPPRQRGLAAWLARRSREKEGHPADKIASDLINFYIGDKPWISANQFEN